MKNIICKSIICLGLLFMSIAMFAQTKVAVYVAPNDKLDETTLQIIGSELVAGIVTNNEYIAIERTQEFLAAIQQEQNSSDQTIDDEKLRTLGKQVGASIVCAANVIPYQDSYYIQARMLNVESATIEATARATSTLASLDEIVSAAESLTTKLMVQVKEKQTEKAAAAEQERIRQHHQAVVRDLEEEVRRQEEREEMAARQEQLNEDLNSITNSIISIVQTVNSYYLDVYNKKSYPVKIVLDGKELGVVNPYKAQRFQLPLESYGKLQAIQTSGYIFYPDVYNYKIDRQQKSARVAIYIR